MTNHSDRSVELVAEVEKHRAALARVYREQRLGNPGNHAAKIADLHQSIKVDLALADIHATHALRQTIERLVLPA